MSASITAAGADAARGVWNESFFSAAQLSRYPLGGTPFPMQRLPELKRTPIRNRHPLVYGAGSMLLLALAAFIAGVGMFWVLSAALLAITMVIGAIVVALRAPSASA